MSGGSHEYVAGYTTGAPTIGGSSEITNLYPDFFNDSTYTKYWDKYTSTTNTNYNYRLLGDATGEMGPFGSEKDPDGGTRNKSSWYKDNAVFINSSATWFLRSCAAWDGTLTGIFAFNNYSSGAIRSDTSYRIVLTPVK